MNPKKMIYEKNEFFNEYTAKLVLEAAEKKLKIIKIALIITAITSVINVLTVWKFENVIPETVTMICILVGIAATVVAGGLWKTIVQILTIPIVFVPFLLIKIFTVMVGLCFIIMGLCICPVCFVVVSFFRVRGNMVAANQYLAMMNNNMQ